MKSPIDDTLKQLLQTKLEVLEKHLDADILVYFGSLAPVSANLFAKVIEDLKADTVKHDKLYVILTTLGGSAEVVERYVTFYVIITQKLILSCQTMRIAPERYFV